MVAIISIYIELLTLKLLGGCQFDPLCSFWKNLSFNWRVKRWYFVTFIIIRSQIFRENFIEILLVVQEIWKVSMLILAIFMDFYQYFGFFWHCLVTKKLMASVYNRWCQHFFTLNILQIDYIKWYRY